MTPKQREIYDIVRRYGKNSGITAIDVGIAGGYPRKKAEKWAKPALKELIKQKKVKRDDGKFYPTELQGPS